MIIMDFNFFYNTSIETTELLLNTIEFTGIIKKR